MKLFSSARCTWRVDRSARLPEVRVEIAQLAVAVGRSAPRQTGGCVVPILNPQLLQSHAGAKQLAVHPRQIAWDPTKRLIAARDQMVRIQRPRHTGISARIAPALAPASFRNRYPGAAGITARMRPKYAPRRRSCPTWRDGPRSRVSSTGSERPLRPDFGSALSAFISSRDATRRDATHLPVLRKLACRQLPHPGDSCHRGGRVVRTQPGLATPFRVHSIVQQAEFRGVQSGNDRYGSL